MYKIVKSSRVYMCLIMINSFQILLENDNSQDKKFKGKETLPLIKGK